MRSLVLFSAGLVLVSCGVKGPPLPPVSTTPQDSEKVAADFLPSVSPIPSPTLSPSPSPTPKKVKKKKGAK